MCTPDTLLDTDFILTDILTLFNSFQWNILQYVLNAFSHVVEELWIRLSVLDAMHCHHSANSKLLQASSTLSELTHLMYHRNDFHRRISETGLQ
jgi:hypothetical protein